MNSICTVRKLSRSDAEAWAVLRREALELHPLAFGAVVPDDLGELVASIREKLDVSEDNIVLGAFDASSLVGIVGVRRETGPKDQHKAFIWGMYVTALARRSGAGTLLLVGAVELARSWPGIEKVQLTVTDAAPDAKRLYERHGFKAWGNEPRALYWKGQCVDETFMALDFRELK